MTAHRRLGLDRHKIRSDMQRAINARAEASVLHTSPTWYEATDRAAEVSAWNQARHEVRRALLGIDRIKGMCFPARHEFYLRLYRYVTAARRIRAARDAALQPLAA